MDEWQQFIGAMREENKDDINNEIENANQNEMQDFYNETGLILRIFINNDGPFIRKHSNNWKYDLNKEFEKYYKQSKQIFGKYASLDFNDVQETYQFWMHMPKKYFSNRKGLIQEMKNIVIDSRTNKTIGPNDIISVKRSNPKFPERVYFIVKGSIPDQLPEYFGTKRYFWAQPNAVYKVYSKAQRCMSWVPQCDCCMYLGHRRGMSCPHLRKTISMAKNKIDNINGMSREEKIKRKREVRVCSFGCTYCSDKNHTQERCTNEAYCINCNENHPAIKDFDNCKKLKELGFTIYQYEDDYKAARMCYMKAPRKPEIGEYVELSPIWNETHSIDQALKLPEFASLRDKLIGDQESINNYKRNLAILSKLKMKILFTKDCDELDLIYNKIDEINVLKNGDCNQIDEILKMQHVETREEAVERSRKLAEEAKKKKEKQLNENNGKSEEKTDKMEIDENENENESENENENRNENGNEKGNDNENEVDTEMNENSRTQESREALLLTPKGSDFESGKNPKDMNLSQHSNSSKKHSKNSRKHRRRKAKDKKEKTKRKDKVSDGINEKKQRSSNIIKLKKDGNKGGTSMKSFVTAAVNAAGVGGAKLPSEKIHNEAKIRNKDKMDKIIHTAVDEIGSNFNNNNSNTNERITANELLDKIIAQEDPVNDDEI